MGIPLTDLAMVAGLLLVNAFLAGSEMAFVSLREGKLIRLAEEGGRGAQVARIAYDPNRYLGAVQLGITLAGFLASATAAVSLSKPVAALLSPIGPTSGPIAVGVVTILLALITLLFGELIPKRLAMQWSEKWSKAAVRPLAMLISFTGPVLTALGWMTDSVVRWVGADPEVGIDSASRDELLSSLRSQLGESERRLLIGAIEGVEHQVRQVMIPRVRAVAFETATPAPEVLDRLKEERLSCAPLVRLGLDNPVGQVLISDLIGAEGPVGQIVRPVPSVPSTCPVLDALRRLRSTGTDIAIVTDEHGGTAGIVSVDDLVDDLVSVRRHADITELRLPGAAKHRGIVVPGWLPIHELASAGVVLPEGRYVTVAGLVLSGLGRIPSVGDQIRVEGRVMKVLAMDGLAVSRVQIVASRGNQRTPAC